LLEVITEIEWLLHDQPVRSYDYYYDQIVCAGELMSTLIMHQYLLQQGIQADWLDVRDVLRTSDHFRDASIDWEVSTSQIHQTVHPILKNNIVITQGFIGATDGNESTTLGREGSDYSAAIFAHILDADSVTIWKDVVAVMSADPKKYPDAVAIPKLSYHEVIEMAYYGAQVIHPKTIKPLQNKNIPLYVKSFLDPNLPGTTIDGSTLQNLPPIIIEKKNQVLVNFQSKDFSFVEGKPAELLRNWMNQAFMKSNLSQHTAISLLCSLDDHPSKIEALALQASELFDVHLQKDLTLLTIRHYTEELIQERTNGKRIIVEQRTPDTVQFVLAD
jgi:aspartate kinase